MSQVPAGRSVLVRVPASSANLGPGFDSIGLALGLWDEYVVSTTSVPGLDIRVEGEGAEDVPTDETHLVCATMRHTWAQIGREPAAGLSLEARNGVPHGRGLGSSATAIVAGVVAALALDATEWPAAGAEVEIDRDVATHLSSVLEGHPDNASASVHGGLTLSWMPDGTGRDLGSRTVTARPRLHSDLEVVVFVPDAQLATKTARAVLPRTVPLEDAAANSGRAALLVHALTTDPTHLHAGTREWLHQEPRRRSYAASMDLVDALRSAGHAAVISGAGPTVLVLTTRERAAGVIVPEGEGHWVRLTPGVPATGAVAIAR